MMDREEYVPGGTVGPDDGSTGVNGPIVTFPSITPVCVPWDRIEITVTNISPAAMTDVILL